MQGWSSQFFPVVGYEEGIGTDDDNTYEPRDYPEDFWEAETPATASASPRRSIPPPSSIVSRPRTA